MHNDFVGGDVPTDLAAEQAGLDTVLVSWSAPPAPPSQGYRITAEPGSVSITAIFSPHTIRLGQPGVYSIRVTSQSQHYPSEAVGPVQATLQGKHDHY